MTDANAAKILRRIRHLQAAELAKTGPTRPYDGTAKTLGANGAEKAEEYARWIAARDGTALGDLPCTHIAFVAVKLEAFARPVTRPASVTFGKGAAAVVVAVPHVSYDPTVAVAEEVEPDMFATEATTPDAPVVVDEFATGLGCAFETCLAAFNAYRAGEVLALAPVASIDDEAIEVPAWTRPDVTRPRKRRIATLPTPPEPDAPTPTRAPAAQRGPHAAIPSRRAHPWPSQPNARQASPHAAGWAMAAGAWQRAVATRRAGWGRRATAARGRGGGRGVEVPWRGRRADHGPSTAGASKFPTLATSERVSG